MVDLPKRKVGIVACSGEELPEGTITRLAALRVLENMRPDDTVTICLPLFLAGGEGDRAFARFYPTISIDGCEQRCAERATEKYSQKPAISINVKSIMEENHLAVPEGRRSLNEPGQIAIEIVAEKVSSFVDELLGKAWDRTSGEIIIPISEVSLPAESGKESAVATCACGSGIAVQTVVIGGRDAVLVGLPLIFQQYVDSGKAPDDHTLDELMETVKIYNQVPPLDELAYREGIKKAYTDYWQKGSR